MVQVTTLLTRAGIVYELSVKNDMEFISEKM